MCDSLANNLFVLVDGETNTFFSPINQQLENDDYQAFSWYR